MLDRIHAFLTAHNTLTLATVGADGAAHASAVFYAADADLALYFLSEPKTLHGQHIGARAQVAASIENNNQDWRTIQGLQLHGLAELLSEPATREQAQSVYAGRFPFVADAQTLAGPLARAAYYRITLTWVRLIDNTRGFGYKEEWEPGRPGNW